MTPFSRFVFLACFFAITCHAQAARKGYCATARTQMELNRCWAREADNAGRRLGATLSATLDKVAVRDKIEQAQTKWIEYRDAHCAAVAALYEGGSMQPMQRASCVVRLTDQRIADLSAFLPEGK